MVNFVKKHKYQILLTIFVIAYIVYFSYLSVLRYKTLYASYYDLGIMHQTVYNTYKGIQNRDFSRVLEMTDVDGPDQIKRMAIHNDPLLALLAPFYFIYDGPETLLIIQTIILALGAIAVFKISQKVFEKENYSSLLSFIFALSYLLYSPLQKSNLFDFHAVTLATTFLLFMFYFWLVKRYWISFVFFGLSILSKEQVGLTTAMFGIYSFLITNYQLLISKRIRIIKLKSDKKITFFSLLIIGVSLIWFVTSVFFIIPYFRGSEHFAVARYSDFGNSSGSIILGIFTQPLSTLGYIFHARTFHYFIQILGSAGFLSLLAPLQFFIALPELAINILSKDNNMRNIYYHYTAVITPFVFISAIYGAKKVIGYWLLVIGKGPKQANTKVYFLLCGYLLILTAAFAYWYGPLPFTKGQNIHPFKYPQIETKDTELWARTLRSEKFKISTVGHLAPFFSGRRYFYNFSAEYQTADYIILRLNEVYTYPEKDELIPAYEKLKQDPRYELIYGKKNFEVYKRKLDTL